MCIDQQFNQILLYRILHNCSIFDGIAEEKYPNVLHCLQSEIQVFDKNETLVNIGEQHRMSGIVLEGCISQTQLDENGNTIQVDYLQKGEVFGADRAISGWTTDSQVELRADTHCRILFLNFSILMEPNTTNCPHRAKMTTNLLRDFARQSMSLNRKIRIISQKNLRSKIKIFLQTMHMDANHVIELPFSRQTFADYLSADRSALSRELCRMRDEGILTMNGRKLKILDLQFLAS